MDLERLRRNGLRVLCLACGGEHRHHFEKRLREKRSPCCNARMVPLWHLRREHPKLRARAYALREREIARLRAI